MKKAIRKKPVQQQLNNALQTGVVFYGLHMHEGPAHYAANDTTILVSNSVIKEMNSTFGGRPVYVGHVDDHTDLAKADGVVSESFYNPLDGNHWSKFVVTTEKGLAAVNKGWKLSNSFLVNRKNENGGQWHGIDYHATVEKGEFHHLAIVPDPRYQQSVILTPEEYKQYNNTKKAELEMLSNSQENSMKKFTFFKQTKVDNSKEDFGSIVVTLPNTGKTVSIEQLCNEADTPSDEKGTFNDDTVIDIDSVKMTFKEFIAAFKKMKDELASIEYVDEEVEEEQLNNSVDEEEEDDDLDDSDDMEEDEDDSDDEDESEDEEEEEIPAQQVQNSKKKAVKKVSNKKMVKNAADRSAAKKPVVRTIDLASDQVKRGQDRYGSKR